MESVKYVTALILRGLDARSRVECALVDTLLQICVAQSDGACQQCEPYAANSRFVFMVKPIFIFFALCLGACTVFAQQARGERERVASDSQTSPRELDAQQRRAALRAAVQTRSDHAMPVDAERRVGRQLSPQEQALLRQQLRQQRGDTP